MKNCEIEKMLEQETSTITPYVYEKVMKKLSTNEVSKHTSSPSLKGFLYKISMACLCFIVLITVITISSVSLVSYESYTIDINPSIELTTNRFNKVIKVNYNNEDAYNIFGDVRLVSKKLDEAMHMCIEILNDKGYFDTEENVVVLSLDSKHSSNSQSKINIMSDYVKRVCEEKGKKVVVITNNVSKDDKEVAKDNDISIGKLKVIKEILDLDDSYTFDELKQLHIKELKKIYIELTNRNTDDGSTF